MTSRSARLAATAAAVALLGTLAAAAPAMAASTENPAPVAAASSAQQAAAWEFVDFYPDKTSCQNGGAYYLRHGYSDYICQLDPTRGWALYVQE